MANSSSGNAFVSEAGGSKSWASQIGHSIAKGSPLQRHFFESRCTARTQWRALQTRYTLRHRLRTKSWKTKSRIRHNLEWKNLESNKIPNGRNPDWIKSQMDEIPNGQNPDWKKFQIEWDFVNIHIKFCPWQKKSNVGNRVVQSRIM